METLVPTRWRNCETFVALCPGRVFDVISNEFTWVTQDIVINHELFRQSSHHVIVAMLYESNLLIDRAVSETIRHSICSKGTSTSERHKTRQECGGR